MIKAVLTLAIAFALGLSSVAFAGPKKPASKAGGDHPTESINLNYGKVEWTYKKSQGGSSNAVSTGKHFKKTTLH